MTLTASSREMLKLVEGFGLSGSWIWAFESNEHVWSPGLYRLLGLSPDVKADFSLFHKLIHPEDRARVPTAAEVMQDGFSGDRTFRVLRGDRALRTVDSRAETQHSPSGRPVRATGVLIDVSEREVLLRAQAAQKRRNRAMFEQVRAFTSTTSMFPFRDFSQEWLDLVGLPKDEVLGDPALPIVPDERQFWRDRARELYVSGKIVHIVPHLVLADRQIMRYRIIAVPIVAPDGTVESWSNYVAPVDVQVNLPSDVTEALERRIRGCHVRAARALLDWSMADLAKASGLSLSTVRRTEESIDVPSVKSIRTVIETVRHHGIRFSLMEDSTITIGKR